MLKISSPDFSFSNQKRQEYVALLTIFFAVSFYNFYYCNWCATQFTSMFDLNGFNRICIREGNSVGSRPAAVHQGLKHTKGLQRSFRNFNLKWFSFKTNSI